MKIIALALLWAASFTAMAGEGRGTEYPMTERYSQRDLLKNWAFSACLAMVAKDADTQDDANATASAYLEYGRQGIEAYAELRTLAGKYAARHYSGSIPSEFNTMKCIDLFHSTELNRLAAKLAKKR